jgi:hypothetical protein
MRGRAERQAFPTGSTPTVRMMVVLQGRPQLFASMGPKQARRRSQ